MGDPLDQAEESGARCFRAFEEFEFGRGDGFDRAKLRRCSGEFFVEDDVPAIARIRGAGGIGAAGALWIGADFGGERDEAICEGGCMQRAEIVGGVGEGAGFFVNAGEERAAFG